MNLLSRFAPPLFLLGLMIAATLTAFAAPPAASGPQHPEYATTWVRATSVQPYAGPEPLSRVRLRITPHATFGYLHGGPNSTIFSQHKALFLFSKARDFDPTEQLGAYTINARGVTLAEPQCCAGAQVPEPGSPPLVVDLDYDVPPALESHFRTEGGWMLYQKGTGLGTMQVIGAGSAQDSLTSDCGVEVLYNPAP
jgi:hypothetical protein